MTSRLVPTFVSLFTLFLVVGGQTAACFLVSFFRYHTRSSSFVLLHALRKNYLLLAVQGSQ